MRFEFRDAKVSPEKKHELRIVYYEADDGKTTHSSVFDLTDDELAALGQAIIDRAKARPHCRCPKNLPGGHHHP